MKLDSSTLAAKTVLLVDGDERTCESRAKALRSFGVIVDCATTLKLALQLYKAGTYSLVLIDLGDGERLAREIRSLKPKQRIGFLVGSPAYISPTPVVVPRRPVAVVPPQPRVLQAPAPIDFGSRIRQAEAAQKNGTNGK